MKAYRIRGDFILRATIENIDRVNCADPYIYLPASDTSFTFYDNASLYDNANEFRNHIVVLVPPLHAVGTRRTGQSYLFGAGFSSYRQRFKGGVFFLEGFIKRTGREPRQTIENAVNR